MYFKCYAHWLKDFKANTVPAFLLQSTMAVLMLGDRGFRTEWARTLLRDFYHPSTMELLEDVHGNFVAHELLLLTVAGDNRREEIARQVRILPGLSPGTKVPSFRRTREICESAYVDARIRAYADMVAPS